MSKHAIRIIDVPYDLGRENTGVGLGPSHLLQGGIADGLRRRGFDVDSASAEGVAPAEDELATVARVNATVRALVTDAVRGRRFPLILAGNCNASLGAFATLDLTRTAVVWFDAHGDFNTPETSPTGFLDGMVLGIATGRCYEKAWKKMGARGNLPDRNILMVGMRNLDEGERKLFAKSDVQHCSASDMEKAFRERFLPALDTLASRAPDAYIHIDVDALDPSIAPGAAAPKYRTAGGLGEETARNAISAIGDRFRIVGGAIASFNPAYDDDDRTVKTARRLAEWIAMAAHKDRP